MLKDEFDVKSRQRSAKTLREFAQVDDEFSEREDEDIYAHYMRQMHKAKLDQAQDQLQDE